ncbi:Endonuclease/exonuclease/phosphatase [Obelidium mucronatum]|nr:Endonuclease/exonuclease/phosphatase [Obelidium mucronatum]
MIQINQIESNESSFIRIMSWNILAQCLIKREQFPWITVAPNCPNPIAQKTRVPLILRCLDIHKFSIAALQEVDYDQWNSLIKDKLSKLNLDALHFRKSEEKRSGGHGLAVLWNQEMFTCVASKLIHFDDHPLIHPTDFNPCTGNIGCLAALKYIGTDSRLFGFGLVVSNHHLFWWPKAKFEKLRQMYILLNEVEAFRKELESVENGASKWPHVMCGDFNTTPSDALYHVLTSSNDLSPDLLNSLEPVVMSKPTKSSSSIESSPSITPAMTTSAVIDPNISYKIVSKDFLLEQVKSFGLYSSAYCTYRTHHESHSDLSTVESPWDGEPSYTSFDDWRGTLDYIMYRKEAEKDSEWELQVKSVLKIPEAKWLEPGLPNLRFPSDHVPILTEFRVARLESRAFLKSL